MIPGLDLRVSAITEGRITNRIARVRRNRKLAEKGPRTAQPSRAIGKPKRRRPPNGRPVQCCVSIGLEDLETIDRAADAAGMSRSAYLIRCALDAWHGGGK